MSSIKFTIVNKCVSVTAKRASGKSQLIRYIVGQERDKFEKIFVICPTEKINNFYSEIVEPNCIFDEWSEEWAEDLIKQMTEINTKRNEDKKERKNVLLLLDDCMADFCFSQSKALKKLYQRGRHINISVLATCQYIYNLPPPARNNTDFCIVGQMNRQSVQLLADEYLSGGLAKEDFIDLYNKATVDYGFLVINCTSVKDNKIDSIYGIMKTPSEYIV